MEVESSIATGSQEQHVDSNNDTGTRQPLQPGQLHAKKRDGRTTVPFNADKVTIAMTKAFLAVEGGNAAASRRIHDLAQELTTEVMDLVGQWAVRNGGVIHVEEIQNFVELALMRGGHHKVARDYILYREARHQERQQQEAEASKSDVVSVTLEDGRQAPLDILWVKGRIAEACEGLPATEPSLIYNDTIRNLFDGIKMEDVRRSLIMSARTLIETEPDYSYVAARLLLNDCEYEALTFLGLPNTPSKEEMKTLYPSALALYLDRGAELELVSSVLKEYDLDALGAALKPERDYQFTYLGLQTLYDRYFIHSEGKRFELPQVFFMRVAMGLALEEKNKTERTIEFYNLLSSFDYMSSTPTLFNSGTLRSQLSSCYLTTVPDHLDGIYGAMRDNALLSKFAGGLGNDWTAVRAMNAHIKGTNGKSQGVVPFLKVANDTAVAVNQGGKRKGAVCAYLETWHLDIEEFLDLRKNTGDERRRTHDMNTANWIPDLFMKRVASNGDWTLFSPDEAPELHDLTGLEFESKYASYEAKAARGEMRNFRTLSAVGLWRKMLGMVFETGHPWLTFKDPCNLRSPQRHSGVIHSSNLCTEITLNTNQEEIAVCNLGSVNLAQHITDGKLDEEKLEKTINTALRMLDNVIDINYYSVPQARRSNLQHRPIGLGLMGFQDALYQQDIPYASDAAVEFADRSMELISYLAIKASTDLSEERGSYGTYEGSLWSQGVLPIDSIRYVSDTREAGHCLMDTSSTLDWDTLRQRVRTVGMRNSNVMAIAPTATISNICGVCQSIEPTFQNLYVKSNLSGEFTIVNPYLVKTLKALNLWDKVTINDLKYYDGSLINIDRIPEDVKARYATAFEIEPKWLINAASRRQKWIDQSQSLNLYMAKPSGKKLSDMYQLAWRMGLKTTYYLRSLGASDTEKSTLDRSKLNAVSSATAASVCSIDNPDCEACQ